MTAQYDIRFLKKLYLSDCTNSESNGDFQNVSINQKMYNGVKIVKTLQHWTETIRTRNIKMMIYFRFL